MRDKRGDSNLIQETWEREEVRGERGEKGEKEERESGERG